ARVLARIGRSEARSGGAAVATLMINGHVEIISDDPAGIQPPRTLIRIGRTDPSPGAPSIGYAAISGGMVVDGLINAKNYAYQGIPFMPILQILPGAAIPDWWRSLQQPGHSRQNPNAPDSKSRGKQSPTLPPEKEPKS